MLRNVDGDVEVTDNFTLEGTGLFYTQHLFKMSYLKAEIKSTHGAPDILDSAMAIDM